MVVAVVVVGLGPCVVGWVGCTCLSSSSWLWDLVFVTLSYVYSIVKLLKKVETLKHEPNMELDD